MERTKDLEEYLEYLKDKELAQRTIDIYLREAGRLTDYLSGKNITKGNMVDYKKYLLSYGYIPTTLNLYIVAANSYLKFLGHSECVIKCIRVQEKQSLDNIISFEEYHELLNYAKESGREKYYVILKTLAMTGIRVSELKFFTVEILNKKALFVSNKQKVREICLPEKLMKELRKYCQEFGIEEGIIFRGDGEKPISRTAVYKMLVKMADMVGIEKGKVHPHSLRHLFAITYMEHYANLFELADLLGHSSLETTRIYARSTIQKKGERINELGL